MAKKRTFTCALKKLARTHWLNNPMMDGCDVCYYLFSDGDTDYSIVCSFLRNPSLCEKHKREAGIIW